MQTVELALSDREGRPYRILSPRFANPADAQRFKREVTYIPYLDRPPEDLPDEAVPL